MTAANHELETGEGKVAINGRAVPASKMKVHDSESFTLDASYLDGGIHTIYIVNSAGHSNGAQFEVLNIIFIYKTTIQFILERFLNFSVYFGFFIFVKRISFESPFQSRCD